MNAEELIVQQLGYSYGTYTAAKRVAAQAGIDLANATVEDVMKFAEESTAAEEDKIALLDYYQYKIIASGATIDTNGSIAQLLAEYEQLGINCEKLKEQDMNMTGKKMNYKNYCQFISVMNCFLGQKYLMMNFIRKYID